MEGYWTDRGQFDYKLLSSCLIDWGTDSITYLLANKRISYWNWYWCRRTKLFDLHKIAVQYYIQDISDTHPAVDQRKPTLLANMSIYIYMYMYMYKVYIQSMQIISNLSEDCTIQGTVKFDIIILKLKIELKLDIWNCPIVPFALGFSILGLHVRNNFNWFTCYPNKYIVYLCIYI